MKKNLIFVFLFVLSLNCFVNVSIAQTNKIDPYSITVNPALYPKNVRLIDWIPSTNDIAYSLDFVELQRKTFPSKKISTIINLEQFNEIFTQLLNDKGEKRTALRRLPNIEWTDKNTFSFVAQNSLFKFDISNNKIEVINSWNPNAENIDQFPNNNLSAYTIENNLFISQNSKQHQITDNLENVVSGQSVHRQEFGIDKGTFWSPEGNFLAFYHMDESMVTDYPIVDITAKVAENKPIKYPMTGQTSHHVKLGIYNVNTKSVFYINTGEPLEQYLTSITWAPDEKHVYIGVLNRAQNHLKLNKYDIESGNLVKTLFEEKSDKYVEPLDPMHFIPGQNNQFLWFSQRDGYRHLYLYDTEGKLIKQVTSGNWIVYDIIGFDSKSNNLFLHTSKDSPIEKHVYSVDLKNYRLRKLSADKGTHRAKFNTNGNYFIDTYSNLEVPVRVNVVDNKAKIIEVFHEDLETLSDIRMPKTEIFTIQNEGVDLYCRVIKPVDFDSLKKYPVMIYVYGGPHAQLITESWLGGAGLFLNYFALEGYIVFTLDNRGSANRGFEFETALHRNMGSVEIDDQMKGVEYLLSQPYVDKNRIGVQGWSYGGYMSIMLMLKHPEIFKVGVAGGPVTDWKYYEAMYGERYMGTPENNADGYSNSSLLNKISDLEGRLLVIHGSIDPVVVWQHSLALLEQSVKDKKHIDYFVYPTHEHNVSGRDRGHLHEKIFRYFQDFLK